MFDPKDHLEDPIHGDRLIQNNFWNDRGGKNLHFDRPVMFCKTDYLPELSPSIEILEHRKFVLVTHNSDYGPERYQAPPNVSAWFAQNASSEKCIPIPIGLERPGIAKSGNVADFRKVVSRPAHRENLLYVNFSDGTNPVRPEVKKHLRQFKWATVQDERIPFRDFLYEVRSHYFTMSPPGNGSDCHRTWEALYVGSVPLCENNYHNREFAKILPILLYDDFGQINLEFLLKGKSEIERKLKANAYTLRALRAQFWIDLINEYGAAIDHA